MAIIRIVGWKVDGFLLHRIHMHSLIEVKVQNIS
jgi:hypothetical protein